MTTDKNENNSKIYIKLLNYGKFKPYEKVVIYI